jgi:hypothetical protein
MTSESSMQEASSVFKAYIFVFADTKLNKLKLSSRKIVDKGEFRELS